MTVVARSDNHNGLALTAPTSDDAIARLAEWAQAADAAYQMAQKLVTTQFVPKQYFNKPEEATAAILAGAELGFNPMASLRAFDNISGTPAPKAITLRAVVQGVGHDIRIDESTDKIAAVSGRRKGSGEWQTSTWTIERAQTAGYVAKNPNWKSNPTAMLIARATAEVCRWVASDAIMGMPYSAEELRDEGVAYAPKPQAQRVTAAEITGQVDTPIAAAEPVSAPPAGPAPMSDGQQSVMLELFRDAGIGDPQAQLAFMADIAGRSIAGKNDMTADLADHVIAALRDVINVSAQGGEQA